MRSENLHENLSESLFMSDQLRLCIVQMTSTNRHQGNIQFITKAAAYAAENGAEMLALPEGSGLMNKDVSDARQQVVAADHDPLIRACQELARQHGLWIHTGSSPVEGSGEKFRNHTAVIDPKGEIAAEYDKIHLFDVYLDGQAASGESQRYDPGHEAVLLDTPWGQTGHSICYDIRFPHLFRQYAKAGARVIFVPSAFTVPTGKAHWEILLRARAIENGCWIVAPAQVGHHDDGRKTWGHSVVINPWGEVVCDLGGEAPGYRIVDLDLAHSDAARRQIPSLVNERDYTFRKIGGAAE